MWLGAYVALALHVILALHVALHVTLALHVAHMPCTCGLTVVGHRLLHTSHCRRLGGMVQHGALQLGQVLP